MSLERELRRQAREDAAFMTFIAAVSFVLGVLAAVIVGGMA